MKYTDTDDHSPKNNFRQAIERIVWAHSNLDPSERAEVLRQFADELENSERFDDMDEHIRYRLKEMGYTLPETGDE